MEDSLRIAVIGDYNFAYHSHNATNQALQHCEDVLDVSINYYWVNERECCEENLNFTEDYDAVLVAPGPYQHTFYFQSIISKLLQNQIPVLGTGDCFKILVEEYFHSKGFDQQHEKIISDNLVEGNYFTGIVLDQLLGEFSKLYRNKATTEYSSSRFSILPQYSEILNQGFEIGARNQFFDPEILKAKEHPFFVFTMFCPQIVSTKDLPHPIFTAFIKAAQRQKESSVSAPRKNKN